MISRVALIYILQHFWPLKETVYLRMADEILLRQVTSLMNMFV